jgi:hypothetical protein
MKSTGLSLGQCLDLVEKGVFAVENECCSEGDVHFVNVKALLILPYSCLCLLLSFAPIVRVVVMEKYLFLAFCLMSASSLAPPTAGFLIHMTKLEGRWCLL